LSDGSFGEPIARQAPLLVSIQEAMRLTGIGRSLLYERMRTGEIAFVHVGKRRLIPFAALREWTERLPPQPRDAAAAQERRLQHRRSRGEGGHARPA
jgi:excisionase family DNA binding protein